MRCIISSKSFDCFVVCVAGVRFCAALVMNSVSSCHSAFQYSLIDWEMKSPGWQLSRHIPWLLGICNLLLLLFINPFTPGSDQSKNSRKIPNFIFSNLAIACVAGVRRGREKGSSSAKRDREREARSWGWVVGGIPRSRFALELPFSLPLRTPATQANLAKQIGPYKSTAEEVSFELSHHRISSTDSIIFLIDSGSERVKLLLEKLTLWNNHNKSSDFKKEMKALKSC